MRAVNYHTSERIQTAIVTNYGRKYLTVVMIDDVGLMSKKVPLSEERYMTPLKYKGKDYPLQRAVRKYKKVGKRGVAQLKALGRKAASCKKALRELEA